LIFPNRRIIEATGCEFRQYGTNSETTQGLELFPEYSDAFGESANAINQWRRNQRDFVDPKDYPSDRDVTDAERAEGLRAWRRVVDQENPEHEVFLPIFDAGFFSEAERSKIPQTGDYEHPEDYVDHNNGVYTWAVCWMQLDETPVAWGMAGVGKTEIGRHMAWLMQIPFERFSITGSTELDDLAGKTHFEPSKGTYFQYGRLPLSWQKPCVIVLDEPNTGQPDVWQFLRPLTDNSKQLVLDTNNGERISKHPDCYLMMAMNPAWDVRNSGVEQLSDADGSRLVHMEFDLPPAELEREIIKKRIAHDGWELDKARLDDIMKIAEEIRPLTANGTIPVTWGIRPQIKVARAMRWFDPVTAYRRAVADLLEPEAREMVLNIVRQNVGEAF
jgi:MoxR-like ATPase